MIKRVLLDIIGAFLIIVGCIALFNSIPGLTGFTILSDLVTKPIGGLLGAITVVIGCIFLLAE